jgi:phage-related protein
MYKIIYYKTENGKEIVKIFIDSLNTKMKAKAFWEIGILEEKGKKLKKPYCDYIKEGVWELRIDFASNIARIFYFFFDGKNIILTNGFIKKTKKTPIKEIEKALKYKKDYERRNKK